MNLINNAKTNDTIIIPGERANEKVNSANEPKFNVETVNICRNEAITNPITPSINQFAIYSSRLAFASASCSDTQSLVVSLIFPFIYYNNFFFSKV